jgi:hypothetical protein
MSRPMLSEGNIDAAFSFSEIIVQEYLRARSIHAPMHSGHEGYAVILEELEELKDIIFTKHPDKARMREEAIQVAAMALSFVLEITLKDGLALRS